MKNSLIILQLITIENLVATITAVFLPDSDTRFPTTERRPTPFSVNLREASRFDLPPKGVRQKVVTYRTMHQYIVIN